ncbi:hypothetical protein ABGB12_32230 [Actinocorallia sp. B10E7]|uniref:hypothetical protein n=1 Tax=Actinocorallia sp. B10E7 TaxID=3153558 RepID=UPI00325F4429
MILDRTVRLLGLVRLLLVRVFTGRARADTVRLLAESERARTEIEIRLAESEQAREEVEHRLAEARERLAATAVENTSLRAGLNRVTGEPNGGARSSPPPRDGVGGSEQPPVVVHELIMLSDRLLDLDDADAGRLEGLVPWLAERTAVMLGRCEAVRLDERGAVDLTRHEVVGSRPAPSGELAGHIAVTVRPGYTWRGLLVRPQQVIAYLEEMP